MALLFQNIDKDLYIKCQLSEELPMTIYAWVQSFL